jgi:hypothetical protein
MEPENLLPYSQVPTTCPYPDAARFSPYPQIPVPEDPSYLYHPIYAWVSQSGFFPLGYPTKTLYTLLLSPYALHAPPISFFSILLPEHIGWGLQINKLLIT